MFKFVLAAIAAFSLIACSNSFKSKKNGQNERLSGVLVASENNTSKVLLSAIDDNQGSSENSQDFVCMVNGEGNQDALLGINEEGDVNPENTDVLCMSQPACEEIAAGRFEVKASFYRAACEELSQDSPEDSAPTQNLQVITDEEMSDKIQELGENTNEATPENNIVDETVTCDDDSSSDDEAAEGDDDSSADDELENCDDDSSSDDDIL